MIKTATVTLLLVAFFIKSEGFDFTLETDVPVSTSKANSSHGICGILQCTESLHGGSTDHQKKTRSVATLTIYKNHQDVGEAGGRWEQLASVTPRWSHLHRVSDAMRVNGELSGQHAHLTLELVKSRDCTSSQFSCVVVLIDSKGQKSLKRSLLGGPADSDPEFNPGSEDTELSLPSNAVPATAPQSVPSFTQLVSSLSRKLDWIESRLGDSVKDLENRLEDKIETSQASVKDKINVFGSSVDQRFGTSEFRLEAKIDKLENRLEDKLSQFGTRFSQTIKQTEGTVDMGKNLAEQLVIIAGSIQAIERNLSYADDQINRLEVAAGQSTTAAVAVSTKLDSLAFSVASLTGATDRLATHVHTFSSSYAGGALVTVEEFFDPLHTGKREWRLIFRGTPYTGVKVYPAYMHGTGIPVEVEEGCKQFNRSLPCANHYRNRDALDNWTGIDEVLFAIYKNDQIVKRVVFNGKGSTYTTWFEVGRVILSSWRDLTTQPHNYFSIAGDPGPVDTRSFFMNLDYNNGCDGFRGWFYAGEEAPGHCTADKTLARPMFQYAVGDTFAVWSSQSVARADAFGVFVKYE